MAVNKRLLQGAAAAGGLVPSEHFGVVTYTGDGSSSNKVGDGSFTVLGLPDTGTAFPYLVSEKVYSSGKYYFEINDLANGDTGAMQCMVGIVPTSFRDDMTYPWKTGEQGLFWYQANGQLYNNGSGSGSFGTFAAGDDVAIAVDFDNNTMTLYKNGSQSGSQITGVPSGTYHMSVSTGYNQYKGKAALKETLMQYSIPSGYEAWGGDIDTSGDWSNYSEYDGVLDFQPDLVWLKQRDGTAWHTWIDSTRGGSKRIVSNSTNAETTDVNRLTSFDTGGFTLGSDGDCNGDGKDFVAWCLKANGGTTSSNTDGTVTSTVQVNEQAGFSIIQYTSPSSPSSSTDRVGHGLGTTPAMVIVKRTDGVEDWYIWHKELGGGGTGALNKFLRFNTDAQATASNLFNTVNSTVVNLSYTSAGSLQNIAYAFAEVEGFSKFGSYTGTGGDLIVETGFEPAFLMIKRTDAATYDWYILDNKRNPVDYRNTILRANATTADQTVTNGDIDVKFLSNGFAFDDIPTSSGGFNASGGTYIYMAFAADPDTEAPTVAKSFSTVTYTGNGSTQTIDGLGFKPGLIWMKRRDTAQEHALVNIVSGPLKHLYSDLTNAEQTTTNGVSSFNDDGWTMGANGLMNNTSNTYVGWAWKADDNEPTALYDSSAIAAYKFEDNVNDVGGVYNGTATSITYNSSGKFNKSADFGSSNSQITTNIAQSDTAAFTWSAWIKVHDFQGSNNVNVLGTMNSSSPYNGVAIFLDVTAISLGEGGSNIGNILSSPSTNTWYHIVVAYDGGTFKCYADGSLVLTVANSNTDGGNFWMGKGGPTTWTTFDGELDQVRIYSAVLNSTQITALYNESASDNSTLEFPDGLPNGAFNSLVSANANAGFSIVKYEGDGVSGKKVFHGLSAAPEMIIVKNLSSSSAWAVFHTSIGATKYLALNETTAQQTATNVWNDTAPNSTTFTVGNWGPVNTSGNEHIAYCFHSVSGFSKFGTFNGNSSTQSITGVGFRPDWVMIKRYDGTENWYIQDSVRGSTKQVYANLSNAEYNETGAITSFDSDGWTMGSYNGINNSGESYLYMAFKIN